MSFLVAIPRSLWSAFKRARAQHLDRLAASISFYALFSLPALLVAAIHVAGMVYGEAEARARLVAQIGLQVHEGLAKTVDSVIAGAVAAGATRTLPWALAVAALLFGASLTFGALQHALNVIWGASFARRGFVTVAFKRLVSFAMVLLAGCFLIATMATTVGLRRFGEWLSEHLPPEIALGLLRGLEPLASLLLLAVLFVLLFKLLPDGRVPWKRATVGALVTASLLLLARALVGRYLGAVDVGSAYGAAGSLVVLLVWVYASSLAVLLGGAFAFAWEEVRGTSQPP